VRRVALAVALLIAVVALGGGCAAQFTQRVTMGAGGDGSLDLRLKLDPEAQRTLGFTALSGTPAHRAAQLFPWVNEADGWRAVQSSTEGSDLVLTSGHSFPSTEVLQELMSRKRPLVPIAGNPELLAQIPDMPTTSPLLNDWTFSLGSGHAPNPGFNLFAQGGIGDVPDATCNPSQLQNSRVAMELRGALQFVYEFRLPGGPGNNDANAVDRDLTTWAAHFGDCPRITADTGGSGNGKVLNGLILAGAAGLILIVLGLRGLRRRRERRG
jgi:hypothetical protein